MPNLILLAGIPGCGKTTYAKTFFDLKYAIVSSDEIRVELAGSSRAAHDQDLRPWDVFYKRIEERLAHSVDVVADATFLTPRHRERARETASHTGSQCHLVVFKNWYVASQRNQQRAEADRVPDEAMDGMLKLYWDTLAALVQEPYDSVTRIESFNTGHPHP